MLVWRRVYYVLLSLVFSKLLFEARFGIVELPCEVYVHSIMKNEGLLEANQKETNFFFARSVFHNMQTFNINYDIICTLYN